MKKYVAKEDVEKGLVNPNIPLTQQKEYVSKVQKERETKFDKTEEKKKRYRESKHQFNWNKKDVTLQTPLPQTPKKILPKPDIPKFQAELSALKKLLQELYQTKQSLIHEMKTLLKTTSQNRKKGFALSSKFSGILKEKNNIKMMIENDVKILEDNRDELNLELNRIKERVNSLRKPDQLEDCSTEELKRRLEKAETKLTTADVDKKEQTNMSHRINDIKRAMLKSKNQIEINTEIGRLNDEDNLIFSQLKVVKSDLYLKYKDLKEIKGEIYQIMKEKESEDSNKVQETRSNEEIKADYEEKIQKVTQEREKVKEKLDALKTKHNKNLDDYYDQQDILNYIKMVTEQKEYIQEREKKRIEAEEKRKKEREEREKQRQKEFQERERRRQEKKKKQEERKKNEQMKKEKLEKERKEFVNRNPHYEQIETCEYLMNYCEMLKPENVEKQKKKEEKVHMPIQELKAQENKEWEKQLKRGAEVIVSKKMIDDVAPQKNKKEKKKKEKEKQQEAKGGFTHHSDISNMFERVHLLPPIALNEVDDTIKQIQQKMDLYNKPTEEEVEHFKAKAEKEFDRIHGLNQQNEKKVHYKQKNDEEPEKKSQYRGRKAEKKEVMVNENEFPELDQ